jgi:hypothetical protein
MKKLQIVLLTFLGYHSVAVTACSHTPPIFQPLQTCGGKLVTVANAERVASDLENLAGGGEADLLVLAETEGWPFVVCLVDWYLANGSAPQKAGAERFRMGHVEARGVSFLPTSEAPPAGWLYCNLGDGRVGWCNPVAG